MSKYSSIQNCQHFFQEGNIVQIFVSSAKKKRNAKMIFGEVSKVETNKMQQIVIYW